MQSFERRDDRLVPVVFLFRARRRGGQVQHERIVSDGLPADVEESDEGLGCGAGVQIGGADGVGDPFGGLVEQRVDEVSRDRKWA